MKTTTETNTADLLLEIGAVKLRPETPFTWTSGWKSPVYCDNRLTLSFPKVRNYIANELANLISREFPQAEALAGVATAGIPQAAIVAEILELPMLYVRSSAKGHGLENQIEGKVVAGQKVVVIEDLVSTGKSSLAAADALKNAGFDVLGMTAIFTYGFPYAEEAFRTSDVKLFTLTNYNALVNLAVEKGIVDGALLVSLNEWREAPEKWLQN
jgi:orotate phosphoribosyltransferase